MTIRICTGCGKIFSSNKTNLDFFCSVKCKVLYNQKLYNKKDDNWPEIQSEMDSRVKQKEKDNDFRLSRRRLSNV